MEGELRAADADRERAAERLRSALNEGRLTLDEYDDRLREAYQAKTYAELDRLFTDLPAGAVVPVPPIETVPTTAPPHAVRTWLVHMWAPWAQAVGTCVAIWFAIAIFSGFDTYFWPVWVAVPWGMVLVVMTVSGLASGEPVKQAARKVRKRKKRA